MELVVFDLEWNSGYCKKTGSFINEIIELGAVKLDDRMEIIGQFSIFIRPEITRRLNHKFRELTQLTNEDLIHGASFNYAVSKFRKFTDGCVIASWSTSDLNALETNCEYYNKSQRIPFLKKYADVQAYCQDVLDLHKNQLALQNAAEMLEIDSEDIPLHRAVGDSILTSRILKKIYYPVRFEPYIHEVNDEFYARLNFHSTFISDINDPQINKDDMLMQCDVCSTQCEVEKGWKFRNKAFFADLYCPVCDKKLRGRIQYKINYDGLAVTKKLMQITAETDDAQATDTDDASE